MKRQLLYALICATVASVRACFSAIHPPGNEDIDALLYEAMVRRQSVGAPSKKTAILNVRVFDGNKLLDPSTVIINGDKIGDPSDHANIDFVVHGQGRVLIPGLIDSHLHVSNLTSLETL